MPIFTLLPLIFSLWMGPADSPAGMIAEAQSRAQELAAYFNKSKHKVKDKKNIHIEINIDIVSTPANKPASELSGNYEADEEYPLRLTVGTDGHVTGSGAEPGPDGTRNFTLRDTVLDGAVLTGIKDYSDGTTRKFEAVFINRNIHTNMLQQDETTFGLGMVFAPPIESGDFRMEKLYYVLK